MKKNNNRGFTLIELLVSVAIISIIATGFYNLLNNTIKINSKNEKDIKAINIAQTQLELARESIKRNGDNSGGNEWVDYTTNPSFIENGFAPIFVQEYDQKQIYKEYVVYEVEEENGVLYEVKLLLYRQKETAMDKYLYTIDVQVCLSNDNFSNRITRLKSQIFG